MSYPHRAIAALLALFLLSACSLGGAPDATGDSAAQPELIATGAAEESGEVVTIGFGAQSYERQVYEPLIAEFNRQNADVRVQFVSLDEVNSPQPGEQFDIDTAMRRSVSAADTLVSYYLQPEMVAKGYLYDLKPLMDADANFDAGDFYPGMLEQYTIGGGVYMLPRATQVQLLSYNKDLWARKGLPEPRPDWTIADLLAAAEQLAEKRGSEVEVYGLVDWSTDFVALFGELYAAGIDLFATPAEQLRLDDPKFVAALERVRALADSGAIHVQPRGPGGMVSSADFQGLIAEGKAAIWQRQMSFSGPDAPKPSFAVGTLPYPAMPGGYAFSGAQGYIVSAGTQHPEAAWRWLAFVSQQPTNQQFMGPDAASVLPARKSIAEQSGYWKNLDAGAKAAVEAILARPAKPNPSAAPDQRFFEPLTTALNAVTSGDKEAEQALRDAQAQLEQLIAQAQLTPTATPNTAPIVVATPQVAAVATAGATTITFGALPDFGGVEPIRKLADTFNQQQSDVFVEVKEISFNGEPVQLSGVAANNDCFAWWNPPGQEEISATLDLQPLIDADPSFKADDYPATLLAPYREGEKLTGLPRAVDLRVLAYNQTAFDAAGMAHPTAEWTIDDLLQAAQRLTSGEGDDKQYGFASLGDQVGDLMFVMNRMGAAPTKGSGEAQAPNFTDPKVVQAARTFVDLLLNTSPHTEIQGYKRGGGMSNAYDIVASGRAAMWLDTSYGFAMSQPIQPKARFTIAIAPPPLGAGRITQNDVNSRGMFISGTTQHADACWAWLKALSADTSGAQGGFPARISIAESDAFSRQAPAGAAEVYAAYRRAFDRSPGASMDEPFYASSIDFYWFFRAIDRALHGTDLDRELDDAQRITEEFLSCTKASDNRPACATQVDPGYEGWMSSAGP
jgi:ABC-type glycerol-3-phosphate transport system substrate-binding protein